MAKSGRKFSVLGWLYYLQYECLLTPRLFSGLKKKRSYQSQNPEVILEESLKFLGLGLDSRADDLLARMGLSIAQFYKMDFKNYSVNFSLAKNQIKNKVSEFGDLDVSIFESDIFRVCCDFGTDLKTLNERIDF